MGEVVTVGIPGVFGLTGEKTAYKDEGILLGEAQVINFVGAAVQVSLSGGVLTVEVQNGTDSIDVIDSLESTRTDAALSANQGRILDEKILQNAEDAASYTDQKYSEAAQYTDMAVQTLTDDIATAAQTAEDNAKAYADAVVVSVFKFQGSYDPQSGTGNYPEAIDTLDGNPVKAGYAWVIRGLTNGQYTLALTGDVVNNGDMLFARVDNPSPTSALDWSVQEGNLGFTPENTNNKVNTLVSPNTDDYPTTESLAEEAVLGSIVQSLSIAYKAQARANLGLGAVATASDTDHIDEGADNRFFTLARENALKTIDGQNDGNNVTGLRSRTVGGQNITISGADSINIGGSGNDITGNNVILENCIGCVVSGSNVHIKNARNLTITFSDTVIEGSLSVLGHYRVRTNLRGSNTASNTFQITQDGNNATTANMVPLALTTSVDKDSLAIHRLAFQVYQTPDNSGQPNRRDWMMSGERVFKTRKVRNGDTVAVIGTSTIGSDYVSTTYGVAASGTTGALTPLVLTVTPPLGFNSNQTNYVVATLESEYFISS
ncbi:hypothetical protein [Agitococcus lubricus]|uniref:Uncharacterized protein n=1 Tax=Agitococcus lubricus TaxID=1077255 RepID=A0A2T5J0B2_9GAMM|nr:hypothetical protein [Agitococcus lubricus]PTQ89788.1 hypothetical protein C8N29_105113 [Agitococcus lubricus]